ncbi:MAG: hypothetical protein ACI828_002678 [Flavobacteriales bacterium]|jgi:hypothetical protein
MNYLIKNRLFCFAILVIGLTSVLKGQSQPDITIEPTRPTNKCPNGALNLILEGGVGPYDVDWYWEVGSSQFLIESNDGLPGNNGVEDLENLPVGSYRVDITDAVCGEASIRVELLQGLSFGGDRIITEKTNASSCSKPQANDGRIEIIEILGISSDYTILWSGPGVSGNTSPIINNLAPDDYTVKITTQEGCVLEKTITICCCSSDAKSGENKEKCQDQDVIFPIAIYQEVLLSPDDEDSYNGQIRVRIHGGTADNVITWTGPNGFTSTNPHIRNLGVGKYCVTVSDGCSKASQCFELISCSSRKITISGNPINTCQGESYGSITPVVQGGDPPYRYSWSNGSSSPSISGLSQGTYRLTVSDKNGCHVSSSYFVDDNIQIRETRAGCVFFYDCNGNETRRNDIGSYTETRPSDCRFQDTRCSDGVLVQERFVGTKFDSYSPTNCTVREFCALTNQTYENHTGVSRSTALEGFDGNNSCWWCHDVEFCEFPSLNGAVQINNIISNVSISFIPGNDCTDPKQNIHRVFCRNVLIWEGCSEDESVCNSSLLGVKMKEEISTTKLPDGRVEVRKTYKVVDFDSKLIFDNLKERGVLSKDARLLDVKESNESISLDKSKLDASIVDLSDTKEIRIELSPNPFDDRITFKISDITPRISVSLSIFDSFGNIVHIDKYYNGSLSEITKTINLVDLPSGVYFLNISLNNSSITKKIIKL